MEKLLELAEANGLDLPEDIQEAGLLTPYAVETRYPGQWGEITEADEDEALRLAEIILNWAGRNKA